MGIFTTECANCGSKDHATKDCPQGLFSSKCRYCGSTEHKSSNCQHGLMSSKCDYCGSKDHATKDCPHGLLSNKCEYCDSTEHATKNCPHGIFSNACTNCGSKNHSTANCPHKTNYSPQTDSSSENSGCGTIIAWLIGGVIAIAVAIWLAVNIVLPIVLLNSALACMILALVFKRLRILFAIVALVGGAYMLFDVINGWFSLNFVNKIVKDPIWITIFVYINTIAVGISTWLLTQPLFHKAKKVKMTNKRIGILLILASTLLILLASSPIPIVYHCINNPLSKDVSKMNNDVAPNQSNYSNNVSNNESNIDINTNNNIPIPGKYPEASEKILTNNEYRNLLKTKYDEMTMKWEIYARHGLIFTNKKLKKYFSNQTWYKPRYTNVDKMLTEIEKRNLNKIYCNQSDPENEEMWYP